MYCQNGAVNSTMRVYLGSIHSMSKQKAKKILKKLTKSDPVNIKKINKSE